MARLVLAALALLLDCHRCVALEEGTTAEVPYMLVTVGQLPGDARTGCPAGYDLAMPKSDAEQAHVATAVHDSNTPYVWAGATLVNGDWKWDDGSSMASYTHWDSGDRANGENKRWLCVRSADGMWHDCDGNRQYYNIVCQLTVDVELFNRLLDKEASRSNSFIAVFWVQLVLGVMMVSVGSLIRLVSHKWMCKPTHEETEHEQTESDDFGSGDGGEDPLASPSRIGRPHPVEEFAACIVDKHGVKGGLAHALGERRRHQEWQRAWREAFVNNNGIFCSHRRSVDNFVRGSDDPAIRFPPTSQMEIESSYYSRIALYAFFWNGAAGKLLCRSLGWSLISGCLGTFLSGYHCRSGQWIDDWGEDMSSFLSDVKWLPTFMLGGHIAFYVERWRQFMFAAWGAEGRLKDLGIVIGSDVSNPDDPYSRRVVFKIYRFMVLALALQYRRYLPQLECAEAPLMLKLQSMGLLMPEEVPVLKPHGLTRMRDAVLSWIAVVVRANGPANTGVFRCNSEYAVLKQLTELRAKFMYFHGNNFYPQPNVFAAFMSWLVDMYCAFMIVVYPFKMRVHIRATPVCGFQPLTIVAVWFMTTCFWGALELTRRLAHPFSHNQDTFNIDSLIAGTEQTLFTSLRAAFDSSRYSDQKFGDLLAV